MQNLEHHTCGLNPDNEKHRVLVKANEAVRKDKLEKIIKRYEIGILSSEDVAVMAGRLVWDEHPCPCRSSYFDNNE